MFDFGIPGYRPDWREGIHDVGRAQRALLARALGRRLTRTWLMWGLEDDVWWADGPVVLDLDGVQLEVNHQGFDEVSLTWDAVDLTRPLAWADDPAEVPLRWRHDAVPALTALEGRVVGAVDLLECTVDDLSLGSVALSLRLGDTSLTIRNGLDENVVEVGGVREDRWRRHRVKPVRS